MRTKTLFLRESDTRLGYRSQLRKLKFIHIKPNKLIELEGNCVLTKDNITGIESVVLIKGEETMAIPIKKGSGLFKKSHNIHRGHKLETIARFEVDSNFTMTEEFIKTEFGQKNSNSFFNKNFELGVNTT